MTDKLFKTFIQTLLEVLEKRGMSQKDLAEAAGVDESGLSKWLKGKTIPRLDQIGKISAALNVEPFILFMNSDERALWAVKSRKETDIEERLASIEALIKNCIFTKA